MYYISENNVLMIVGGTPTWAYNDVELIDLSGQNRQCQKPSNFPGARYGSVGAFIRDKVRF